MLCDMPSHLTSIPLNSKGQGQEHLMTFAKGCSVRMFWSTFSKKQLGLVALLSILLALSPYVYKRSVSSYPKQILHCSLSAQGSDQDLMILLLWNYAPLLIDPNLASTLLFESTTPKPF